MPSPRRGCLSLSRCAGGLAGSRAVLLNSFRRRAARGQLLAAARATPNVSLGIVGDEVPSSSESSPSSSSSIHSMLAMMMCRRAEVLP